MKDKFLNFLKKSNIDVDLFMYYTDPKNNGFAFKKYDSIQDFFDKEPCVNWIKNAFRWDITPFKSEKLLELDTLWVNVCKKQNTNILKAIPNWIQKILQK